jgi:hypothetical protein
LPFGPFRSVTGGSPREGKRNQDRDQNRRGRRQQRAGAGSQGAIEPFDPALGSRVGDHLHVRRSVDPLGDGDLLVRLRRVQPANPLHHALAEAGVKLLPRQRLQGRTQREELLVPLPAAAALGESLLHARLLVRRQFAVEVRA